MDVLKNTLYVETMKMLINSIYLATEGEGIHIGKPQVFVRFQGCNIGCINCDSMDTWDFDDSFLQEMDSVLLKISELTDKGRINRVSITGGDPLHPKNVPAVKKLVQELKARRYFVNIEAAGTRVVDEVFDLIDYISFDFKTPSTGVKGKPELILKMAGQYKDKFQVKSVIENRVDFETTKMAFSKVQKELGELTFDWILTPCYKTDEKFPQKRFQDIIEWNHESGGLFRVIGQQHKWFYDVTEKQV